VPLNLILSTAVHPLDIQVRLWRRPLHPLTHPLAAAACRKPRGWPLFLLPMLLLLLLRGRLLASQSAPLTCSDRCAGAAAAERPLEVCQRYQLHRAVPQRHQQPLAAVREPHRHHAASEGRAPGRAASGA
jgi:hypothetical protein